MMKAIFAAIFFLSFCYPLQLQASPNESSKTSNQSDWQKLQWVHKAARVLRSGEGLTSSEDTQRFMSMSREAIVNEFLEDPRFIDTVVDFNLFFLGFQPAKLRSKNGNISPYYSYDRMLFAMPRALAAAQQLVNGGSYFSLFDKYQPYYLMPFRKPYGSYPDHLSDYEVRKRLLNNASQGFEKLIKQLEVDINQQEDVSVICNHLDISFEEILIHYYSAALPENLASDFMSSLFILIGPCFVNQDKVNPPQLLIDLKNFYTKFPLITKIIKHPAATHYPIQSSKDIISIDPNEYGVEARQGFSELFWRSLPNSSTNFNRKRSAHILKTFFCDDLTPINIASPDVHSEDQHASAASCAACHYKLDPMAGFFRNHGIRGINFSRGSFIVFDDLTYIENDQFHNYIDYWRAKPDSSREWDVGFIRSATKESLNIYGESLDDLYEIIASSKEVKQCLTRRMMEYFLGKDQIYDAKWRQYLASKFQPSSKNNDPDSSSVAFKNIVAELVLSQTFAHPNPESNNCYDYAPDHQPSALPCEVDFIIQKNCKTCHAGSGAAAGLDLLSWQPMENGVFNFVHKDEFARQFPRSTTLQRILERLSTSDQEKIMPMRRHMDTLEREQLYRWVHKELEQAGENE